MRMAYSRLAACPTPLHKRSLCRARTLDSIWVAVNNQARRACSLGQRCQRSTFRVQSSARSSNDELIASDNEEDAAGTSGRRPWNKLEPIWEAAESVAMASGIMKSLATPSWRVMLLSDGSVTRHLQLLTDLRIEVECIEQEEIQSFEERYLSLIGAKLQHALAGLPEAVRLIPGPLVQRQVFLTNPDTGDKLVYAASWWSKAEIDEYMRETNDPIWVNLQSRNAELYRQIDRVYLGHNAAVDRAFEGEGRPVWGRYYIFFHQGRPLTVIYEVFSNKLEQYLGPNSANNLVKFATGRRE